MDKKKSTRILITPGEPAGIGPDVIVKIAQQSWSHELIVIADPNLLTERAKQLNLSIKLNEYQEGVKKMHQRGALTILPVTLHEPAKAGELSAANAEYVLKTLMKAASMCIEKKADAIVTGPVHKAIINKAGIPFTGHTEFFAHASGVKHTVMLFVVENQLKVALATTHLPLKDVADAISKEKIKNAITVLQAGLKKQFKISNPYILVCGLNPHAGEEGHLGLEEINIIAPAINELNFQGFNLEGPLSADTIFTPKYLKQADAVLAMFHDQALPVVKYAGFGHAVNVTLGLPYIRTSVDHGTAIDIAGTGAADENSMAAAIRLAINLCN